MYTDDTGISFSTSNLPQIESELYELVRAWFGLMDKGKQIKPKLKHCETERMLTLMDSRQRLATY